MDDREQLIEIIFAEFSDWRDQKLAREYAEAIADAIISAGWPRHD